MFGLRFGGHLFSPSLDGVIGVFEGAGDFGLDFGRFESGETGSEGGSHSELEAPDGVEGLEKFLAYLVNVHQFTFCLRHLDLHLFDFELDLSAGQAGLIEFLGFVAGLFCVLFHPIAQAPIG